MASSFPKLPGYVPSHDCTQTQWAKTSHVKLEANQNAHNRPVPLYPVPDAPAEPSAAPKAEASMSTSQRFFRAPAGEEAQAQFEPTFVKLDKVVLRFFGFFKEAVVESNLENWRVRKLLIYYFLEDSTLMLNEPKETNSGTPQGLFLKRQAVTVAGPDGTQRLLQPMDFQVGSTVDVHGRTIKVVDADSYTRDFFQSALGVQLAEAEAVPDDNFKAAQQPVPSVKDKAMMDFLEHSLGGGKLPSWKQFLDNDRKVLRFFTLCEDSHSQSSTEYTLHYYLADDTVEVRENHFQNNGKDTYPLLLKRSRVPKHFAVSQPGQEDPEADFVTEADFYPGQPIVAFSRVFHITGVDAYTQRYYKEKFGRHFPFDVARTSEPRVPDPPKVEIPPYNGFGDEEDTLSQV